MKLPVAVAAPSPSWPDHGMNRCWASVPMEWASGATQCSAPVPHPIEDPQHVGLCPDCRARILGLDSRQEPAPG